MIGRRLLKRMTRLGLSMYAAIWCMSFTVCAYDDPIADMVVGDKAALLSEAAEVGADADILYEEEELVDLSGEEEALLDEEVVDTGSEEDAASSLMEDSEPSLDFNISSLTITDTSKSYKFKLIGTGALADIDPADTHYEFSGLTDSENAGIELVLDSDKNFVLSFNDNWDDFWYKEFELEDSFKFEEVDYNSTLKIVVSVPVTGVTLKIDVDEEYFGNGSSISISDYDASQIMTLTLLDDVYGARLNASRISWNVTDMDSGESIDYEDDTGRVLLFDNDTIPDGSKNLFFGDGFIEGNYNISAFYNNSYFSANGTYVYIDPAEACCKVDAYMPADVSSIGMTLDGSSVNNVTLTDVSKAYTFGVQSTGLGDEDIDPSQVTYSLEAADKPASDPGMYNGAYINLGSDGTGILQFDGSWRQYNCSDFNVTAQYVNSIGETLTASCRVVVYVPLEGILLQGETGDPGNNISIGRAVGGYTTYINITSTNEDSRIIPFKDRMSWTLNRTFNEQTESLPPEYITNCIAYKPGITNRTEIALTLPSDMKPGNYEMVLHYANSYMDSRRVYHMDEKTASCWFYVEDPYYYNVVGLWFGGDELPIFTESNTTVAIDSAGINTEGTISPIPPSGLNPDLIRWGLTEPGSDEFINTSLVSINPGNYSCAVCVSEEKEYYELDLVAKYYNGKDPEDPGATPVEGRIRLIHEAELPDIPEVEAHLPEKTLKVQIYNGKNEVPVTMRTANVSESRYLDYNLTYASLTNSFLSQYVTASIGDDGKTVSLRAKRDVLDLPARNLTALIKSKYVTGIEVIASVEGHIIETCTIENLTVTFGNVKPTAKNIKVNGTLEFDSYYEGEIKELSFTGANVKEILPVDAKALGKLGFRTIGGNKIQTTIDLPSTKKGSFKIIAVVDDDENYNLPEGYNVTLIVNYVVKNSAPKLVTDVSSILLNTKTGDTRVVNYYIDGVVDYGTDVSYYIVDSKNKNCTGELSILGGDYDYDTGIGWYWLSANEKTRPGQTYKLCQCVVHDGNSRTGAVDIITVKTVAEASTGKMGLALKATGGLDASYPKQTLNITCTGKNVNLYGRETYDVSVKLKNGTEVTELFLPLYDPSSGVMTIHQTPDENIGKFPMYETGLAGQEIDITIRIKVSDTEWVNATYSTKIASSKVTPKLGLTKVSINPDYTVPDKAFLVQTTVDIPVNNLPGGFYTYNVTLDYGNLQVAPFTYEFIEGIAEEDVPDIIRVIPNISALESMIGKSCTVKIIPEIPGNKGVAATCKISVTNPAKTKASVTAKAYGSIDSVRDDTRVNLTVTFKNVYLTEKAVMSVNCINITRTEKKKEIECTDQFVRDDTHFNKAGVILARAEGEDLVAGKYKAYLCATIYDSEGKPAEFNTTVTFKVTRGKTGTTIKPSPVKLVNRDYARYATVYIEPKYSDVNDISSVNITGPYADKISVYAVGNGQYELEFADTYVEGSVVKKIWQAITKFVNRTVKVEVYYEGSTKPDTVSTKVKINP